MVVEFDLNFGMVVSRRPHAFAGLNNYSWLGVIVIVVKCFLTAANEQDITYADKALTLPLKPWSPTFLW